MKVATRSGKSGLATIQVVHSSLLQGYRVRVQYSSYTDMGINEETQELTFPAAPFDSAWTSIGRSVFGSDTATSTDALASWRPLSAFDLPDMSQDWTISTQITVRLCHAAFEGEHQDML